MSDNQASKNKNALKPEIKSFPWLRNRKSSLNPNKPKLKKLSILAKLCLKYQCIDNENCAHDQSKLV